VADERDKIRAMMGLPSTATKDPVVVGGTPFGQAGTAQAPQTPMSYGGTSFGQAGSAAPTTSNEYQSALNEVNKTLKDAEKALTLAKKSGNKKNIAAAQSLVDLSKGELSDLVKLAGSLGATGGAGVVNPGNRTDASYVAEGRTGTSNTGQRYINGKLVSESEFNKFLYGNQKGSGAAGAAADGAADADARKERQSAFDLLKLQFDEYGLGALVEPLRGLIQEGISPSEFAVRLRQTEPYKKRFAANAARINKGLRALSEAEYLDLEDGYQSIMRNYGLPATYYTRGELGRQEGFEKFIGGDVSPAELEERIMTAQNRVINAPPDVMTALKQFYPDINNSDILTYTLDPERGLSDIKKKVLAAEIGGAALGAKLGATVGRAEELARYGVTADTARAGFGAIGGGLERGRQLADIYQQPDYTQAVAEEEVFNLPGQAQAGQKRKKIIGMEKATFGGQSGMTSGALSRDRAGSY
jgi:hypothetical protein